VKPGPFFSELRRRRVLRVMGGYAIAAWLVVEAYTTVHPILLEGYEWTDRVVVILALLGFPIVFTLSWIFDITPDGVRRTLPLEELPAQSALPPVRVSGRQRSARAAGFFGLGILVALASFAAYAGYHHEGSARASRSSVVIESIAVLPFEDMSPERDQEYFTDGVTEELLNRLAHVPELRVAARTSSFAFKGHAEDVRNIGMRLGVESVLEGSVRRDGDRLRVSAKLIDAVTGYQLWSDSFEGESHSVFELQDQIATAVVDALRQHFTTAPEAGQRGTSNVRAYELYLLGLKRWNARGDRELRQALDYFEQAVEEDPDFALAWAGMAQTYALLPSYGSYPVDSAVVRGSAAAAAAIAKDASLADAYAAMGLIVQNFEWDLRGAESYYRRALGYQPNHAAAHLWYAEALMLMGRYGDAATHVARVLEVDPLAPNALYADAFLKMLRGRSADALATWRDLGRLHPDFALGLLHHALAAGAAERHEEAARALDRLAAQLPAHTATYEAVAAALQQAAARPAAMTALANDALLAPSERAAWYMLIGARAQALQALEQGYTSATDIKLLFMMVHPVMRPLHRDARFRRIATELELGIGG
jgi:adenylate cyclase